MTAKHRTIKKDLFGWKKKDPPDKKKHSDNSDYCERRHYKKY